MSHTETLSRIASRSLRVALKLGFVAIVLLFVVYAAPQMAGAEQSYVVTSGSMEPVLSPGDVIIVYDTSAENIQEGDIITFVEEGDKTVTHRVVGTVEEGDRVLFETQGDSNDEVDPAPVRPGNIVGEVPTFVLPVLNQPAALHIPLMGHIIGFAGTDYGYVLMVGVPVALLLINEVWSFTRTHRTDTSGAGETASTAESAATQSRSEPSTDPAANGAPTPPDDGTYTISATDLTLTLGALLLLAAYSGFIAYRMQSPISVAVAVAAIGSTGLTAAIRYLAAGEASEESNGHDVEDGATEAWEWHDGSDGSLPPLPDEAFGTSRVALESLDEFAASTEERHTFPWIKDTTDPATVGTVESGGTGRAPPDEELPAGSPATGPGMAADVNSSRPENGDSGGER